MMGVNNLLNIGNHALFANQVAISTTGNNVANVNTDGYSRQSVRFDEFAPLNGRPGQIGMGAYAAEVYRNFNRFVENAYLDRFTQQQRWEEQSTALNTVQSLFNESNRKGISSAITEFFKQWNNLAGSPDDTAIREALVSQSDNLALLLRDAKDTLKATQDEMDQYIRQSVDDVNNIVKQLRSVNKQVAANTMPGNNANSLMDERDRLVRKLASYVDIKVLDNGPSDFQVLLGGDHNLLSYDGDYSLQIKGPGVEQKLYSQNVTSELNFSGSDSYEYTLEYVNENQFKVSLDGGKSWVRNDDGSLQMFTTPPIGESLRVKNLEISFSDPNRAEGDTVLHQPGDTFTIVPKNALYWSSPTRGPINITPQRYMDGRVNPDRLTEGKLAAYYDVRDYHVGQYSDRLDALAESLIWEVNRLHSQGVGLIPTTGWAGTNTVREVDQPLGSGMAGMPFYDRLTQGSLNLYFYDSKTGETLSTGTVDFDPTTTDIDQFDPSKHSLTDVVEALNNSFPDPRNPGQNLIKAEIVGGKVQITAADGVNFSAGSDTTGLLAGLGLNTFFSGTNATNMAINPAINENIHLINSSSVDGNTEANNGDGAIASLIAKLATKDVKVSTVWETSTQSLSSYYIRLVGVVGSDASNAMFNQKYNNTLSGELEEKAASISGVNLDEEMTNLIRYQHSYTAAAKLITTADKMMEIVLGLKQ